MAWHILIVEDEQDSREIVQEVLALNGVQTDAVRTAEEALERLSQDDYHAAVIDLMLPGMDGLDLARSIRGSEHLAHLPCIAITAYASASLRRQAAEAGYDLYYSKPITPHELVQGLTKLLS